MQKCVFARRVGGREWGIKNEDELINMTKGLENGASITGDGNQAAY